MQYTIQRYPTESIDVLYLSNGRRVTVRPVLPQDADLTQALVRNLSMTSRMRRFLSPVRELSPAWLTRFTQLDYRQHMALMAETFVEGRPVPVGEVRYASGDGCEAGTAEGPEFALLVADAWQRCGIGRQLLQALVIHAQRARHPSLHGYVHEGNLPMRHLAQRLGFQVSRAQGEAGLLKLIRRLSLSTGVVSQRMV